MAPAVAAAREKEHDGTIWESVQQRKKGEEEEEGGGEEGGEGEEEETKKKPQEYQEVAVEEKGEEMGTQ